MPTGYLEGKMQLWWKKQYQIEKGNLESGDYGYDEVGGINTTGAVETFKTNRWKKAKQKRDKR